MSLTGYDLQPITAALNRIADAQFTQAKVTRLQVRVAERQCAVAETMCDLQQVNLATTKALEATLNANLPAPDIFVPVDKPDV